LRHVNYLCQNLRQDQLNEVCSNVSPIEDFNDDMFTYKSTPRGAGVYKVAWSDEHTSAIRLVMKDKYLNLYNDRPKCIDFINQGDPSVNMPDLGYIRGGLGLDKLDEYETKFDDSVMGVSVLNFNYSHELGADIKFRQAIACAVNRAKLFPTDSEETNCNSMIPKGCIGYVDRKINFNPDKAKRIVSKHFSLASSPEKPLLGIFHGAKGSEKKSYIKELEHQLAAVGLYFNFIADAHLKLTDNLKNAVLVSYGVVTSNINPLSNFSNYLPGTDQPNQTLIPDTKLDELLDNLDKSKSLEAHSASLQQISEYFNIVVR